MDCNNSTEINEKENVPVSDGVKWYVMRDLKRANDKFPAYKVLAEAKFEVFTPMIEKVSILKGKRVRVEVPFVPDLLFVHAAKSTLDSKVENIPTLQYRYVRGGKRYEGMTVDENSMNNFIKAVKSTTKYHLYKLSEISNQAIGSYIRIVGGTLDGYEGNLLKVRGSKKKRLLVSIENYITAAIEVEPEFIRIVESTAHKK